MTSRATRNWQHRGDKWEPGDPLYQDPRCDWRNEYGQCVRELFQIIDDHAQGRWNLMRDSMYHCPSCLVGWDQRSRQNVNCWACGAKGKPPRYP